ncbi:hypothetical protein O6027_19895 [Sphingomonas aerolata]|uniref:hypothetical protein n=1 Tax=Sphingomonas aerolata TaxID=185951 RepID=UPI00335B4FED
MTPQLTTSSIPIAAGIKLSSLAAMEALSSYVAAVLLAATCIALVTAAAVQLFRPLLSAGNQMRCVYDWALERLRRSFEKVELDTDQKGWLTQQADQYPILTAARSEALRILHDATNRPIRTLNVLLIRQGRYLLAEQFGIKTRPAMVSDEVFMAGLQDEVRSVMTRPADNMSLFMIATADISVADQIDLLTLNCASRRDPAGIAYLLEPKNSDMSFSLGEDDRDYDISSIVAALEDVASRSVETALDELQRRLLSRRVLTSRLFTLTLALLAAMGAGWASSGTLLPNVYAVGFISGLLAVALRDMLSGAVKRFSR